jgi:hypothetical protein
MDPTLAVNLGLTVLDEVINMIKSIKGQSSLTPEQLIQLADAQDLKNKDDIKALLAL